MYHHGIVSEESYQRASTACEYWNNHIGIRCNVNFTEKSQECLDSEAICIEEIPRDVDIYNIDAEVCLDKSNIRHRYTSSWNPLSRLMMAKNDDDDEEEKKKKEKTTSRSNNGARFEPGYPAIDPCIEDYVAKLLNQKEVQEAIHVRPTQWDAFGKIRYLTEYDDMTLVWPRFFRNPRSQHWRIVIFSGDFDACVPFEGTQHWIRCLGRPVLSGWHPWRVNNQVAGNVIEYDKITFITIKGSGHMVPSVTPAKGFNFFQRLVDKIPW